MKNATIIDYCERLEHVVSTITNRWLELAGSLARSTYECIYHDEQPQCVQQSDRPTYVRTQWQQRMCTFDSCTTRQHIDHSFLQSINHFLPFYSRAALSAEWPRPASSSPELDGCTRTAL